MSRSTPLVDKIIAVHRGLARAGIAHAFGGALALAWCTRRPRGTSDIDVNIFLPMGAARDAFAALPEQVTWTDEDVDRCRRDGQVRVFWGPNPVDVFLNTTPFHEELVARAQVSSLAGVPLPFLACDDLAVFKAFFDRTKDWADIEEMLDAGAIDAARVGAVLESYLGEDHRVAMVRALGQARGDARS